MSQPLFEFISQRGPEVNMLYAAYRFFSKFPQTRQQYLEDPKKVASSCWLTAQFCNDVFVEDPQGDWVVYYVTIRFGGGYHDFTLATHRGKYYMIDSYWKYYTPRVVELSQEEFAQMFGAQWDLFANKWFPEFSSDPNVKTGEYKMKRARLCPHILSCIKSAQI